MCAYEIPIFCGGRRGPHETLNGKRRIERQNKNVS